MGFIRNLEVEKPFQHLFSHSSFVCVILSLQRTSLIIKSNYFIVRRNHRWFYFVWQVCLEVRSAFLVYCQATSPERSVFLLKIKMTHHRKKDTKINRIKYGWIMIYPRANFRTILPGWNNIREVWTQLYNCENEIHILDLPTLGQWPTLASWVWLRVIKW